MHIRWEKVVYLSCYNKRWRLFAAGTRCSTGRQQWAASAAAHGGRSRELSSATVLPSTALSSSEETQDGQERPGLLHNAAAVCCKVTDTRRFIQQCFIYPKLLLECFSLMTEALVSPPHHILCLKNKSSADHLPVGSLRGFRQHRLYNWTHNKAAEKKRYLFWQHIVQLFGPTLLHSIDMTCKEQHLFEAFDICQQ